MAIIRQNVNVNSTSIVDGSITSADLASSITNSLLSISSKADSIAVEPVTIGTVSSITSSIVQGISSYTATDMDAEGLFNSVGFPWNALEFNDNSEGALPAYTQLNSSLAVGKIVELQVTYGDYGPLDSTILFLIDSIDGGTVYGYDISQLNNQGETFYWAAGVSPNVINSVAVVDGWDGYWLDGGYYEANITYNPETNILSLNNFPETTQYTELLNALQVGSTISIYVPYNGKASFLIDTIDLETSSLGVTQTVSNGYFSFYMIETPAVTIAGPTSTAITSLNLTNINPDISVLPSGTDYWAKIFLNNSDVTSSLGDNFSSPTGTNDAYTSASYDFTDFSAGDTLSYIPISTPILSFADENGATINAIYYNNADSSYFYSGISVDGAAPDNSLNINSSGNVGIGTSSPTSGIPLTLYQTNTNAALHLSGGNDPGDSYVQVRGDNEGGIRIRGGGSSEGGSIEFGGGLRDTDPGIIKFSTGTSGANSERMRIDSSGNVGIGTSGPAYKLDVSCPTLGAAVGSQTDMLRIQQATSLSNDQLLVWSYRHTVSNNNWTSVSTRIQKKVDNILQGYMEFNPAGNLTGIAWGTGYDADQGTAKEQMRLRSTGLLQFNSGYGSVATAYGCRAWVQFNGVGTPTIRSSGNVSSITDNDTGLYTINFVAAMPDANYCTIGSSIGSTTSADGMIVSGTAGGASVSTGAIQVRMAYAPSNGATDITHVNVAVFR